MSNTSKCFFMLLWIGMVSSSPIEFKPKRYERYVNDIFVMFRSRNHIEQFLDYMNIKHPNTRFTFEIEDEDSFSFLEAETIKNM